MIVQVLIQLLESTVPVVVKLNQGELHYMNNVKCPRCGFNDCICIDWFDDSTEDKK